MTSLSYRMALMVAVAVCLTACGGGGGGGSGIASTPPPPPASTSAAVTIFQSPATQEFAAIGSGDDLRIRYDAATNQYEVMAEGLGWERLVDDPLSSPSPGNPNTNFAFSGAASNQSYFMIRAHYSYAVPEVRYQYSNLAAWGRSEAAANITTGLDNFTAFGMATPTGAVPLSGSATYQGMIAGTSTVPFTFYGELVGAPIDGTVTLNFDFAGGALAGNIHPYFTNLDTAGRHDLGTIAFSNTIFGVGSTSYSGNFATSVSGPNSFSGLFTGPNAQELIGKWTFPFISPIDGAAASAAGAWIAKKGP